MTTEEKLIWVDLMDHEIGYGEKLETHQKNILHRAFSVFLYSKGKILIQQREKHKYHSGELWANSCCSHPRKGEELLEAAYRRVKEELGITASEEELIDCGLHRIFINLCFHGAKFVDNQVSKVFLLWKDVETEELVLQEEEIEECGWFTYEKALNTLNYENDKYILNEAMNYFIVNRDAKPHCSVASAVKAATLTIDG